MSRGCASLPNWASEFPARKTKGSFSKNLNGVNRSQCLSAPEDLPRFSFSCREGKPSFQLSQCPCDAEPHVPFYCSRLRTDQWSIVNIFGHQWTTTYNFVLW